MRALRERPRVAAAKLTALASLVCLSVILTLTIAAASDDSDATSQRAAAIERLGAQRGQELRTSRQRLADTQGTLDQVRERLDQLERRDRRLRRALRRARQALARERQVQ